MRRRLWEGLEQTCEAEAVEEVKEAAVSVVGKDRRTESERNKTLLRAAHNENEGLKEKLIDLTAESSVMSSQVNNCNKRLAEELPYDKIKEEIGKDTEEIYDSMAELHGKINKGKIK